MSESHDGRFIDRFWAFVPDRPSKECWVWYGANFTYWECGKRKFVRPHRMAWRLTHGRIPKGMLVIRVCENERCVNPDHLRLERRRERHARVVQRKRFGAKNLRTKLTDEEVLVIRTLRAQGATPSELAVRFGVARSTISNICARRRRETVYEWAAAA